MGVLAAAEPESVVAVIDGSRDVADCAGGPEHGTAGAGLVLILEHCDAIVLREDELEDHVLDLQRKFREFEWLFGFDHIDDFPGIRTRQGHLLLID